MSNNRELVRVQTPPDQPGFLGAGHVARPVIQIPFSKSDPFIMLMDDLLDKNDDEPAGGPHPHAGFETVSLLIEGELGDGEHKMKGGDFQIMTAGSGVIHTETIDSRKRLRMLQLWLSLPKEKRWATPRVQDLPGNHAPSLSQNGVALRLYSGTMSGLHAPTKNHVPLIIADFRLEPGTTTTQQIPANYNAFLYVLEGSMKVGAKEGDLEQGQVGWLNLSASTEQSDLFLAAGDEGVRFVLYAGQPQGEPIVSHGPFIGDSNEDILRLYQDYRQGRMKHISTVPEAQKIRW